MSRANLCQALRHFAHLQVVNRSNEKLRATVEATLLCVDEFSGSIPKFRRQTLKSKNKYIAQNDCMYTIIHTDRRPYLYRNVLYQLIAFKTF